MGATFSRLKNWIAEVLNNTDLNAEIDNILNNLGPSGIDDYSTNAATMRTSTDPGESGTESLATSLAGELERIRFVLKEMKGADVTYWYQSLNTDLSQLSGASGTSLSANRIVSGQTASSGVQPNFLIPNGGAATLVLTAATTPFSYVVNDTAYNLTANVTITGLTTAASTNNTALINDANAAGGQETKRLGMYGSTISVDSMGSAISALVGQIAAFKLVSGGSTEYFEGFVASTTAITKAKRGIFFNSSANPVPAITYSDNNTITLLKATYAFLNTGGTIAVTYTRPTYAASQPSSPSIGDYWFDTANDIWKTYNSVSWVTAASTYIGMCAQDTAGTVAARSEDFFKAYDELNTINLEYVSATTVRTKRFGAKISVNGNTHSFRHNNLTWDIASDLESGITEAASTKYFFYITEGGGVKISSKPPIEMRDIRLGYYHPDQIWRCVGHIDNDGSSNFSQFSLVSLAATRDEGFYSNDYDTVGTYKMWSSPLAIAGYSICDSTLFSKYEYPELYVYVGNSIGFTVDSFRIPDTRGRFPRGVDSGAGVDPDAASRTAPYGGGNTGDNVGSYQADAMQTHNHNYLMNTADGTNPLDASNFLGARGSGAVALGFTGSNLTSAVMLANTGTSTEVRPENWNVRYMIKVRA